VALLSPAKDLPIYLDNEKLLYMVPGKDVIIVGGTYEENVAEEITEQATLNKILANAYEAMPSLQQQQVIGSRAGLRPYRKEVRVERDTDKKVVHNYGHGAAALRLLLAVHKQ
jgi:D-amino-acid oxidase